MARYVFDIETNGLMDELDRVHCIVIQDLDTGEITSCADQPGYPQLSTALDRLAGASLMPQTHLSLIHISEPTRPY